MFVDQGIVSEQEYSSRDPAADLMLCWPGRLVAAFDRAVLL